MRKVKVWTLIKEGSFMTLGPRGKEAIAARVKPYLIAEKNGIALYVIHNPKRGGFHVAEGTTGAFVGYDESPDNALAKVAQDIQTADPKVIAEQLAVARKQASTARLLPADEFWEKF